MTIALIATNPYAVIKTFAALPASMSLPSGDTVQGAQVGWTGEGLALVAVTPFVPPSGQVTTGEPSYSIDDSGNVTETYATAAAPAPSPTVSAEQFLQLFTTSERRAIEASTDPVLKDLIVQLEAAGTVVLDSAPITQGVAYIVSANLLTQDRANEVLAGTPPPTS